MKTKQNRKGGREGWSQRKKEAEEIEELVRRIEGECSQAAVEDRHSEENSRLSTQETAGRKGLTLTDQTFTQLPLSSYTLRGLKAAGFEWLTPIQRAAIPHALAGRDVLGEAKTGSGKTLAFLVPLLEKLYRLRWSPAEGLAALVISPTRELAAQIYDVCKTVGRFHDFSAGCIIGGKSLEQEQSRIHLLNILIATPGRLQQHMEESSLWEPSNLQLLVVDEADRMLDMGFMEAIKFIVSQLPTDRQSLLFSATLRSAVRQLAVVTIKPDPARVTADAESLSRTPSRLKQICTIVPLASKLSTLLAFLRSHNSKVILVFASSCKQVRFIHDAFQQLNPGMTLLELHGRQSQQKRFAVFEQFKRSKAHVCLFSTDIASRGIDFPSVDWVVQLDCPDCVDSYIHRVGRTARFQNAGNALLFLLPSEVGFLKRLEEKRINVAQVAVNPKKSLNVTEKLKTLLSREPPLVYLAQRSLIAYTKSVALMRDKTVFKLRELPIEEFALSLGLSEAPSVKIDGSARQEQAAATSDSRLLPEEEADEEEEFVAANSVLAEPSSKKRKNMSKLDRLKVRVSAVLSTRIPLYLCISVLLWYDSVRSYSIRLQKRISSNKLDRAVAKRASAGKECASTDEEEEEERLQAVSSEHMRYRAERQRKDT